MKIGVQMYSLREYIKTEGVKKALENIAECGADCIEPICDDYGVGYEEVARIMRENGLKAYSMHIDYNTVADKDKLARLRDAFGLKIAVIPWMDKEKFFDNEKRKELFGNALENANALGMVLAYHNHNFEFEKAGVFEALPGEIRGLKLQPDIFWLKAAGIEPLDFVRANRDNIALIHIKEFGENADAPAPIVGSGATNAGEVLRYMKSKGCEWAVLEYEKPCCDDIIYLKKSIDYMREAVK